MEGNLKSVLTKQITREWESEPREKAVGGLVREGGYVREVARAEAD